MRNNINPNQISLFDPLKDRGAIRERVKLRHAYNNIISIENLLVSWQEFLRGKRKRKDVAEFSLHFMDNILALHKDLIEKTYRHEFYYVFKINDPKPRDIHKASVRDRLVHHAICRILYPYFDRKFIFDSYSCRIDKGTHKAINRLRYFGRKISKNNTRQCWILKGDIKKFFANIDHQILTNILEKYIADDQALWLLKEIIDSFQISPGIGLPLGNLTSQLLVNVYMNEFDQFAKRELKIKNYIRYADDFVILNESRNYLEKLIPEISKFLEMKLKLSLHPKKVFIKTLSSGVDFLGWVNFPQHRILRTKTKRRILSRLKKNKSHEVLSSYLGLFYFGNAFNLYNKILNDLDK